MIEVPSVQERTSLSPRTREKKRKTEHNYLLTLRLQTTWRVSESIHRTGSHLIHTREPSLLDALSPALSVRFNNQTRNLKPDDGFPLSSAQKG